MTRAGRQQTTLAGKYLIEAQIGTGGIGVVYAATHRLTRERVALKLLREENLHDPDLKRRFIREARAAANLRHPNVVRLIDLDEDPDQGLYMVLELLSGETLQERLSREGRIPLAQLCEILFPIMHAVAAAHDHGIVHRDLKPANIFLSRDARGTAVPKLLDFGLARVFRANATMPTRTGDILGTPDHMSPEQAYGDKSLGPASDVWSMAVVIYGAIAGEGPFVRKSIASTMIDIASATYVPLDQAHPEIPRAAEVQAVIGRALMRDAAARTPTMLALMTELARVARVDLASVLGRHGLEWPRVSIAPTASNAPSKRTEAAAKPRSVQATSHIARRRTGLAQLRTRLGRRTLVALLLVAAIFAAWGAMAAMRDEPAASPPDAPAGQSP